MQRDTDCLEDFMSLSDGEAIEDTRHELAATQQLERWKYTKSSDILEVFLDANARQDNTVITNAAFTAIHVSDSGLNIEEIRRKSPIAALGLKKLQNIKKLKHKF